MARRDDGLLDLLILLPWWVSVIASAVGYVGLKYLAPLITIDNPYLQAMVLAMPTLATIAAVVLIIPAPISAINAWQKRKLLDDQKSIQTIRDLSWREFELLVAEAYRRQGYTVVENQTAGADGGIDVRLKKDGQTHLVQCKNWKTSKVGVKVAREMYGVMTAEQAASVIIIISGVFTQEAKNFAQGKPIDLVDGSQLEKLISNVQVRTPNTAVEPIVEEEKTEDCPKCGSPMTLRTARKGKNAGGQFWGCSTYPKCRYTCDI